MKKPTIVWISTLIVFFLLIGYWTINNIENPSDLEVGILLVDMAVGTIAFLLLFVRVAVHTKKRTKVDLPKLKNAATRTPFYRYGSWIVIASIVLSLWFYWFQLRPNNIRKKCFQKIKEKSNQSGITRKQANDLYRICLVDNGMRAEALLDN